MMLGHSLRYLCGWLVISSAVVALMAMYGTRLGITDVPAACRGVAMAALADVITFALHAYGLFVRPARFLIAWGASVAFKFVIFSGVIAWAAFESPYDARSLAIGCAIGFVVLTHHEALVICRIPDRKPKGPRTGDAQSEI